MQHYVCAAPNFADALAVFRLVGLAADAGEHKAVGAAAGEPGELPSVESTTTSERAKAGAGLNSADNLRWD